MCVQLGRICCVLNTLSLHLTFLHRFVSKNRTKHKHTNPHNYLTTFQLFSILCCLYGVFELLYWTLLLLLLLLHSISGVAIRLRIAKTDCYNWNRLFSIISHHLFIAFPIYDQKKEEVCSATDTKIKGENNNNINSDSSEGSIFNSTNQTMLMLCLILHSRKIFTQHRHIPISSSVQRPNCLKSSTGALSIL